ncbi:TolC family protein, partial [Xanthovirga aplysinae]|uniref:TolC family protein n=1 Tax=Xanthovirga aplysinae TaxID=2529853 RepID=UPI0012BC6585
VKKSYLRFKHGHESEINYLISRQDYIRDTVRLINQKIQIREAKIALNVLLSRKPSRAFIPTDSLSFPPKKPVSYFLQNMYKLNPRLITTQAISRTANFYWKLIKAERFPLINFHLSYSFLNYNSEVNFLEDNQANALTLEVVFNWKIFQGFTLNIREKNAKVAFQKSRLRIDQLELELEALIQSAFIRYSEAYEILYLQKENLENAKRNIKLAIRSYDHGEIDFDDYRQIQYDLVETATDYVGTLFSLREVETELLFLSGTIINHIN